MDTIPGFLRLKYDDVEFIDRGAHGRVYKCTRSGIDTAVKLLNAGVLDSRARERFKREIDILRRLDHKHIVKLIDAGEDEGHYWYESEYANERHFGLLAPYLFYSDVHRVKYFNQICLGLQALHENDPQIIHRDIKPRNILCFTHQEPELHTVLKIADFGIAAIADDESGLTTTGAALGTVAYMAPERVRVPKIKTLQSDIYSLGITFLEVCTGHTTPSSDALDLLPDVLKPVIEKMLKQRPDERYRTVAEVLGALNSYSHFRLLLGREPGENESGTMVSHVNISRELENSIQFLFDSNEENVLVRLADLEQKLDRLVDARDDEAHTLKNIPVNALELIEKANPDALYRVVLRFENAARLTSGRDFFSPEPDMWAKFLADIFQLSAHRPTKHRCLEGLAYFFGRFSNQWTKIYLYRLITSINDPSYMEYLACCFRGIGREDIALLLSGVPEDHPPDVKALVSALNSTNGE